MKQFSFLAFSLSVLLLLLPSCSERRKLSRMLHEFMTFEVTIPDDMECVSGRRLESADIDSLHQIKFIVYYDSLSCSSCGIAHLNDLIPIYNKSEDDGSFSFVTIFSPRPEEVEEVRTSLMLASPLFPVYIDVNGSFAHQNAGIPSDARFHYFLTDSGGHPIFVGNPLGNSDLERLMASILESM